MFDVFINSTGHYLPGKPIDNETVEEVLGLVNGKASRLKKKILKSNGIKTRHYAIDKDQKTYIDNAEMASKAAERCIDELGVAKSKINLLCAATSQGDVVLPGFGSMVQAELDLPNIELHTSHGICSSSVMALKNAYLQIKSGEHKNALVVASEFASRLFKASRYEALDSNDSKTALDFNAEFLRWMLSDGAGAFYLENHPRDLSFRIDWIKGFSHADAMPLCMTVGRPSNQDDNRNWQDFETYAEAEKAGAILIRQDIRLLDHIVKLGVDGALKLIRNQTLVPSSIDFVLCHFSSHYFKSKIFDMLTMAGVDFPEEKWYTNLYTRGNTGCASILIMLDEFRKTHKLKNGQKIFLMVPESGRFNTTYFQLTVVKEK